MLIIFFTINLSDSLKKKEFFLFIFLILLQSCSGGRIGNFLESSFNDVEKTSKDDDSQNNFENKKFVVEGNEEVNYENYEKSRQVENLKTDLLNEKDKNLEKMQQQKNNKIENSSEKGKIKLQTYKIILILKDVDPKDPTEDLSTILRNSEVNFEIEKIERILDSKNKSMNKN